MKKTIIDLFEDSVVKYGAKTFLLEKKHRAFEPTTYAETREQALETGAGLAAAGIRLFGGVKGDADTAAERFVSGALDYDPNVKCDHHEHAHGGEGHACGEHGCGSHGCGGHSCH